VCDVRTQHRLNTEIIIALCLVPCIPLFVLRSRAHAADVSMKSTCHIFRLQQQALLRSARRCTCSVGKATGELSIQETPNKFARSIRCTGGTKLIARPQQSVFILGCESSPIYPQFQRLLTETLAGVVSVSECVHSNCNVEPLTFTSFAFQPRPCSNMYNPHSLFHTARPSSLQMSFGFIFCTYSVCTISVPATTANLACGFDAFGAGVSSCKTVWQSLCMI